MQIFYVLENEVKIKQNPVVFLLEINVFII